MIIDSHCHLHDAVYADARQTLRVALTYDVWGVVGVGCDPASNEKALAAAAVLPKVIWACLGFHPEWTHLTDEDLDRVEGQVSEHRARIVGLGEIGLPWYSLETDPDASATRNRGQAHLD